MYYGETFKNVFVIPYAEGKIIKYWYMIIVIKKHTCQAPKPFDGQFWLCHPDASFPMMHNLFLPFS